MSPSDTEELDRSVIDLLRKVHEYEALISGEFAHHYIEAYSLLSRANYNSTRRFSTDMLDMRPREAVLVVSEKDGLFTPIRRTSKPDIETVKEKNVSPKGLRKRIRHPKRRNVHGDEEDEGGDCNGVRDGKIGRDKGNGKGGRHSQGKDSQGQDSQGKNKGTREIRKNMYFETSLSQRLMKLSVKPPEKKVDLLRDPIRQFGPLVPPQLKQAQTYFSSALADTIRVACLRKQIQELLEKIEREREKAKAELSKDK